MLQPQPIGAELFLPDEGLLKTSRGKSDTMPNRPGTWPSPSFWSTQPVSPRLSFNRPLIISQRQSGANTSLSPHQPIHRKPCECDGFVRDRLSAFIETGDRPVRQDGQVGIGRAAGIQQSGDGPGLSRVGTEPHCQVDPVCLTRRIREEHPGR